MQCWASCWPWSCYFPLDMNGLCLLKYECYNFSSLTFLISLNVWLGVFATLALQGTGLLCPTTFVLPSSSLLGPKWRRICFWGGIIYIARTCYITTSWQLSIACPPFLGLSSCLYSCLYVQMNYQNIERFWRLSPFSPGHSNIDSDFFIRSLKVHLRATSYLPKY